MQGLEDASKECVELLTLRVALESKIQSMKGDMEQMVSKTQVEPTRLVKAYTLSVSNLQLLLLLLLLFSWMRWSCSSPTQ